MQLLLFLALSASCDFGDTNLDPTRQTDAELKEILPTALAQTSRNLASIGGRVTGTVIQHFKGIDAQPESYSQYLIDERTLDQFWRTGLFGGAMKDCQNIIEKAKKSEQPHYEGIAKILMAVNLGIATSFWGEVPFKEAFNGLENLQPVYDSQEALYQSIQQLLNEAIEALNQPASNNPPQEDDLIFGGDATKWIATSKALQARYFLHLSKRRTEAAQDALNAIRAGAFQSLEQQPDFPFSNNVNEANPLPLYNFERPDQLAIGDFLHQLLKDENDPRLSRYAVEIEGMPLLFDRDASSLYWGQFGAPLPLISLAEVKFIEAEALLRLHRTEEAETALREACITHFQQMNIPEPEYSVYLENHLHFLNATSFDQQLELVLTQKYIALFGQNPIEAWVDFRRTGYPELQPATGANPSFNPSLVVPRRYLYPISERISNETNFNAAIQRQGGHLMDVNIWAFK